MLPELNIGAPIIKQVSVSREELPLAYAQLLNENPLLGRIEGATKNVGWTDQEIRTMQLLVACKSNASLMQRLRELESSLASRG